jgi:hypothetical protein
MLTISNAHIIQGTEHNDNIQGTYCMLNVMMHAPATISLLTIALDTLWDILYVECDDFFLTKQIDNRLKNLR